MAWQYDDEDCLVRDISHADPLENRVVCWINGAFNHGPRIALAPAMEEALRELLPLCEGWRGDAASVAFARDVLRELDEARAKVAS